MCESGLAGRVRSWSALEIVLPGLAQRRRVRRGHAVRGDAHDPVHRIVAVPIKPRYVRLVPVEPGPQSPAAGTALPELLLPTRTRRVDQRAAGDRLVAP